MPAVNWEEMQTRGQHEGVVETCVEKGLVQMVAFPTHLQGNTLDIVLTNSQNSIRNIEDKGRLGRSDHVMIEVKVEIAVKRKGSQEQVRNWRRADWTAIKSGLREEWPTTEDQCSTEQTWRHLRTMIDNLVEKHVPVSRMKPYDTTLDVT